MSKKYRVLFLKPSTLNFSGFTLLELLVVLAIMALLTGMSAPAISGYLRGARLRGGARQVASALRMARQLAITKRTIYSVDCSPTAREFWIEYNGGGIDSLPGSRGVGSTLVGEIRTLPDTINFYTIGMTYPYDFTARGTVGAGSIFIVDPRNNGREIVIVATTGRVRVDHWSPPSP